MGKKSKSSKKNKGVEIIQNSAKFTFHNGDEYDGEYMAHRSGVVWRQGHGVYHTHDGQIYEGEWKDDKLDEKENIKVSFTNGDQYFGRLTNNTFNGAGTYEFKNGTSLTSSFSNNKPSGQVGLVDYLRNIWFGQAENEHVLVYREHVFSYELDEARGKGVRKRSEIIVESPDLNKQIPPEDEDSTWSQLEARIFAKSTKTVSDPVLRNPETEWFKRYRSDVEMMKTVPEKLRKFGRTSLTEQEKDWYTRQKTSLKVLEEFSNKKSGNHVSQSESDSSNHLLDRFFGEEFEKSCPPVRVFYVSDRTQVEQHHQQQDVIAEG